MKKLLPIFVMALVMVGCQKYPDTSQLTSDLMVYTHYDNHCDFSQFNTFYVPDSLLILDSDERKPEYLTKEDRRAQNIIETIETEMKKRGFVEVKDRTEADMGIQATYIRNTNTYVGYDYYWWFDYYWPMSYWDPYYNGWYPYYPYPVSYSYTVGTVSIEIANLKKADTNTNKQVPFIWTALMSGVETSGQINISRALTGIYQAFDQSPYIHK